jgi:hypothetical protein
MPKQSAVNRRNEKGSIKKGFQCPCYTCKVNWRAKQDAVGLFNFLNPFIDRIVFDEISAQIVYYSNAKSAKIRDGLKP